MTYETQISITDEFYQVGSLLSSQQQLSTLPHNTSVAEAVEAMDKMGVSQLPVKSWTTLLGVFSYRSLCQQMLEMEAELDPNELIGDMPIGDFVENHRFYNSDDNWEPVLRHLKKDKCVLVGNSEDFNGTIAPIDVVRFLYQVAKPFVVLAEIELSIRRMIATCVDETEFQTCVKNSLSQVYSPDNMPSDVSEMSFNEYVQVISNGDNWSHFESFFGTSRGMRSRTHTFLKRIGELRNDVFHFRRSIDEDDVRFLNNKRDWLHKKARIFEGAQRKAADAAQLPQDAEVVNS